VLELNHFEEGAQGVRSACGLDGHVAILLLSIIFESKVLRRNAIPQRLLSRMKRVLFVNRPDADERPGGDTVQMRETARALRSLGLDVEERLGPQDEGTYRQFDLVHLFNLQTPAFTVVEAEKAKRAERPLAVSTIFWDFGAELLISESRLWGRLATLTGRPLALRLAQRRVDAVAVADRDQMRRILALADVCLPNSEAEIPHLRHLTRDLRGVRVVPNGIDAKRFDPSRSLPLPAWASQRGMASRGYVLVAARVDPHKNQVGFCRAMQGYEHPIVIGGQAENPSLVEQCERLGAIYVGRLTGDDLVAAYGHAKVHALPSFRETPGLSSLEAAAMGCAVVSTNAGSAREFFANDAEYCDPRSAVSMRESVERAWKSGPKPTLAARVRREYTWEAAARATLAAYETIA